MYSLKKEEWEHRFADAFFDLFVKYELKTMNERIMPEGEIYTIAYDNAVARSENFNNLDPVLSATTAFEELLK